MGPTSKVETTKNDPLPSIMTMVTKGTNFEGKQGADDDETASTASMLSFPSSVLAGPSSWWTLPESMTMATTTNNSAPTTMGTTTTSEGRRKTRIDCVGIRRRRMPSPLRLAILSLNREQPVWEEIEDDLFILLDGSLRRFHLFQTLYFESGLMRSDILRSLAYLSTSSCDDAIDIVMHDEHVSRLANFLCTGRTSQRMKLAALDTLVRCLEEPSLDSSSSCPRAIHTTGMNDTYEFLTTRTKEWDHIMDQTTISVIYELRAKCLRELDLERERVRRVTDKADEAAVLIATGAKLVEFGIQQSNRMIEGHIDSAGRRVMDWVEVDTSRRPLMVVDRDAVVAVAFSNSARRLSQYAQEGTKQVMQNIHDASVSGLRSVGNKFEEGTKFGEQMSPEALEVVKAAGKVGLAAIGATAIVGEAIIDTGRRIASKTASVTADIVEHKYGRTAGKVAKDMGATAGNVLRTMANVTFLERSVMAKAVAKTVGKDQLSRDVQKAKETIQMLERHLAKKASQTLGIEWNGHWIKDMDAVFDLEGCREEICAVEAIESEVNRSSRGQEENESKTLSVSRDKSNMVGVASSEKEHSSCDAPHWSLATKQKAPHQRQLTSSRSGKSDQPHRQRYPLIQFV